MCLACCVCLSVFHLQIQREEKELQNLFFAFESVLCSDFAFIYSLFVFWIPPFFFLTGVSVLCNLL